MENAGAASFRALASHPKFDFGPGSRVVVLAGPGNNGGDGLVVARLAHAAGAAVSIYQFGGTERFGSDANTNLGITEQLKIPITRVGQDADKAADALAQLAVELEGAVAVDALFGVGLKRDVKGVFNEAIGVVNAADARVLSLDIPSGVHGDTGQVLAAAVRADVTVAYGVAKLGNLIYPGFSLCGELFTTRIGFPPQHDQHLSVEAFTTRAETGPTVGIQARDPRGHKGSFGQALFVAGARGYFGAPRLAAMSFLRAGGGYSRLATPESIVSTLSIGSGPVVFLPMPESKSGSISIHAKDAILAAAKSQCAAVVGPGVSVDAGAQELVRELAGSLDSIPLVIDGDGLTSIAVDPGVVSARSAPTILTPHLGEMARLLGGVPVADIQANLTRAARQVAAMYSSVVVVKGPHTLTAAPDGRVRINLSGNSGMGTAGSGDVLCGCIASMLCRDLDAFDAASSGVFLHGMAGDAAAQERGEDGVTADDILDSVSTAMQWYRNPELIPDSADLLDRYAGPGVIS